jgi:hypothetical protein
MFIAECFRYQTRILEYYFPKVAVESYHYFNQRKFFIIV